MFTSRLNREVNESFNANGKFMIVKENKKNASLQVFKIIAACLIVFIHWSFPGLFGTLVISVARFAVPFFFTVSGFFLIKNSNVNASELRKNILRKIKHIVLIIIFSEIINLIYKFIASALGIKTLAQHLDGFRLKNIPKFILFNKSMMGEELWFLYAQVYSYFFFYIFANVLLKKRWFKYVCLIPLFVVYIIELLVLKNVIATQEYTLVDCYWRSWINLGVPFVALGLIFKENEDKIKSISINVGILLFCFGNVLAFFERWYITGHDFEANICYLIVLLGVYVISINDKVVLQDRPLIMLLGDSTLYVYVTHMCVGEIIYEIFNIETYAPLKWILPIVVVILSFALSVGIYFTKNVILTKIRKVKNNT